MLGIWHRWLTGIRILSFRDPMDFRHLGAVWERLAVPGHASIIMEFPRITAILPPFSLIAITGQSS